MTTIEGVRAGRWTRLALLIWAAACGGDAAGPAAPAKILIAAGSTKLEAVGASTQLTATVLDGRGRAVTGAAVIWSSANGAVIQVDPAGVATAMGAGQAVVKASSGSASGSLKLSVDPAAAIVEVVSGGGQQGPVGLQLPQPVRFRVSDANGHSVAGSTVQFGVTRGGGSVTSASSVTAADGTVQVLWTLGTKSFEPQELTATAGSISRTISATARAGAPLTVELAGGANQTGLAGEPLTDSLSVRALDSYKNPVPGVTVVFSVTQGGGALAPQQAITGDDGRGRSRWVLGPNAGANAAAGTSAGLGAVTFQATGLPNGAIEGTLGLSASLLSKRLAAFDFAQFSDRSDRKPRAPATGPLALVQQTSQKASTPRREARVDTVAGEWLVRMRDDALSLPAQLAAFSAVNARVVEKDLRERAGRLRAVAQRRVTLRGVSPVLGVARVGLAAGADAVSTIHELRREPDVHSVEPVILYHAEATPIGSASSLVEGRWFPQQSWHYGAVGLPRAWDVTLGSPSVIVAVVDDGIRFDHISVTANLTTDGYDFVTDTPIPGCTGGSISSAGDGGGPDPDPTIPFSYTWHDTQQCAGQNATGGHGLHVAGTIAASNGGIVGIAPGVRVRPIRVLGVTGSGSNYDIAQGILYAAGLAADNGTGGLVSAPSRAHIINLSLSGSSSSPVLAEAVQRATEAGSLLIAAAGNNGSSNPQYPAAYPEVVSVSAVGPNHTLAPYSNWGSTIDIAAPGGNIAAGNGAGVWSAQWSFANNMAVVAPMQGTSMAAPHVSGVAALVLSRRPGLTPAELKQALISTAVDLGPAGQDAQYGHGLIHAFAAVTDGQGFPSTLRVHLYNASSGARVASTMAGANRSFRFPGLTDGTYFVFAGGDDRGDGVTGRPGWFWGAYGGTAAPVAVAVTGHGTRTASFDMGLPAEREPNGSWQLANMLPVGGYVYGHIELAGDQDHFRVQVGQPQTVTFETAGWYGGCGFGYEVDTVLELVTAAGTILATHDDVDYARDRLCSRLTVTLNTGTHYLRVRGFGTGTYAVRAW